MSFPQTEQLTEVLFDNAPDAIVVIDSAGKFVRVNENACRLFGYEKDELADRTLETLLPERFRERHLTHRQDYNAQPHIRQMIRGVDLFGLRSDGSEFPLDIMLSPVKTAKGTLVIAVIRDTTESKRIEQALRDSAATFKVLFNQAFQFMSILTPDGIIKEVNQAKLDVIGAKIEDLRGKRFSDMGWWNHSKATREQIQDAIEQARHGEFVRFETEHRDSQGKWITVDFSLKPVHDDAGKTVLLIAEGRDISDLKRLMQQREDYVATLTHDLKTPILAANRAIKLLLEGDFGEIGDAQRQILETILDSNESMYHLVRTLLDVYRYESGSKTLAIADYDLSAAATKLLEELKPFADGKKISLQAVLPSDAVTVPCDGEEIRRVLQNLVDNALKYSFDGGTVTLCIESSPETIKVSIRDKGKGISNDDQLQLFQRFWQKGPAGRHYASTGLGLYLCRKIIELHGGKIWCESDLGAGTTFHFVLPTAGLAEVGKN